MVRQRIERMIFILTRDGRRAFLDTAAFPEWVDSRPGGRRIFDEGPQQEAWDRSGSYRLLLFVDLLRPLLPPLSISNRVMVRRP